MRARRRNEGPVRVFAQFEPLTVTNNSRPPSMALRSSWWKKKGYQRKPGTRRSVFSLFLPPVLRCKLKQIEVSRRAEVEERSLAVLPFFVYLVSVFRGKSFRFRLPGFLLQYLCISLPGSAELFNVGLRKREGGTAQLA